MGPLKGVRVIEMAGLGPAPFAGVMLADMGAEVVVVRRKNHGGLPDFHTRGKRSLLLDLKDPADLASLLDLIERTDMLFEGFRPGVMERLGLGPEVCLSKNPRLVYGRMTGWGQDGPLASAAGHDLNYIALTGALHSIGPRDGRPAVPLNLIGDYGGGAMFLLSGLLAALYEAQRSGQGQVVDAAMTDGTAMLMSLMHSLGDIGLHGVEREAYLLNGGAPFYNTYETADGKWISIAAIEPQFYALLLQKLELSSTLFSEQMNTSLWPKQQAALQEIFAGRTRAEWCELLEGTDVCFAPVLDQEEARLHPHNKFRGNYAVVDGKNIVNPAPRFSRTKSVVSEQKLPPLSSKDLLQQWDKA